MARILTSITSLPVEAIEEDGRLRPVSEAGVQSIAASIRELGDVMKDRPHVRKIRRDGKEDRYVLMAGGHRLGAARLLEWAEIPVICWECDDHFAQLMEIDDNLAGADLNALDTAVFLAARKRVYEQLHPETKAATGAELVAKRWDTADTMSAVSFVTATAEKFGLSDRQIRRIVQAGEALAPNEVAQLRRAPRPITLKDLGEIAKITDPTERYDIVDSLEQGTAKSAAEARRRRKTEGDVAPPADPVESGLQGLLKSWSRAPMAARRRFLEEIAEDLDAMAGGARDA